MNRLLLFFCYFTMAMAMNAQQVMVVTAGSAKSLLATIEAANKQNSQKDAERLYILIPNGYYDLGEKTLTRISGHNLSIIGESMNGTLIRNAPDKKIEGISRTAVFQNRGTNNYYQDLTLKNDLDYYNAGEDGRAVCLQDKGNRTICNRVRMMSFQDTYYSDKEECQHYMQNSEIHGTIDFICGAGDVWFERCLIVTEKRSPDGTGRNIIAAPRTANTPWGYVFNHCTIRSHVSGFHYGRSWHTNPRCVWLYTTLLSPEKLLPTRFDPQGMKISSNYFKEYGTMDAKGNNICPTTNIVHFTLRDLTHPFVAETILKEEETKQFTIDNMFGEWHPDRRLKQLEQEAKQMWKKAKKR